MFLCDSLWKILIEMKKKKIKLLYLVNGIFRKRYTVIPEDINQAV